MIHTRPSAGDVQRREPEPERRRRAKQPETAALVRERSLRPPPDTDNEPDELREHNREKFASTLVQGNESGVRRVAAIGRPNRRWQLAGQRHGPAAAGAEGNNRPWAAAYEDGRTRVAGARCLAARSASSTRESRTRSRAVGVAEPTQFPRTRHPVNGRIQPQRHQNLRVNRRPPRAAHSRARIAA